MSTGKTVVVGLRSFDAMTAELRAFHLSQCGETKVPPGWFTIDAYASANDMPASAARCWLDRQVLSGHVEKKKFYVNNCDGRRGSTNHYKILRKKAPAR